MTEDGDKKLQGAELSWPEGTAGEKYPGLVLTLKLSMKALVLLLWVLVVQGSSVSQG